MPIGMKQVAFNLGIPFINTWEIMGNWATANASGYMADNFHCNASGYAKMATRFAKQDGRSAEARKPGRTQQERSDPRSGLVGKPGDEARATT
jgi:hypothetical protein